MAIVTRASVGRSLTHNEMDANLLATDIQYGQLAISNSSTGIPVTAATDPTLFSNADYIQIAGIWNPIPHGLNNGVTQQASSFTIGRHAHYQIQAWASLSADVSNTNIAIRFAVNGTIGLERRPRHKIGTGGDRVNISAHGFVELNAGDIVTLWIAADKTANLIVEDCVFSAFELRTL